MTNLPDWAARLDLSRAGQHPQLIVPPGHWQRARPAGDDPVLVSCVVVPGFDFADFTLDLADQRSEQTV